MVKHKIKDPKTIACIVLASVGFPTMVILCIVGGVFFSREHPKVLNYANSMCRVDSRSYKTYQCQSRASRYTCYGPIWEVHHGESRTIFALVEEEKRYLYSSDALNKANEYQIGSSYSCWYDTRNSSVAQWDRPNVRVATILLSCGGLAVLLTGVFIFLAIRFIKQEILQNKQDSMNPYSHIKH